ncbi:MAG: hypothetical protein V9E96_05735 [Chitinophagaceae bacterium]
MKKIYISVIALLMVFMAKAQFPAPYCNVTFANGKEPIIKSSVCRYQQSFSCNNIRSGLL